MKKIDRSPFHENRIISAKELAKKGNCLRRNYGAVLVTNNSDRDRKQTTGYTHTPEEYIPCDFCMREHLQIAPGTNYGLCTTIHAEWDALMKMEMKPDVAYTLYLAGYHATGKLVEEPRPCEICSKMLSAYNIIVIVEQDGELYQLEKSDYYEAKTKNGNDTECKRC